LPLRDAEAEEEFGVDRPAERTTLAIFSGMPAGANYPRLNY
jgi:hypothetical protein